MKTIKKAALAAIIGGVVALPATADTVILEGAADGGDIRYTANSITVQGGEIRVKNAAWQSGRVPGSGGEGWTCDPATTTEDSTGGTQVCRGTGLANPEQMCVAPVVYDEFAEKCVLPDEQAPRLTISANPARLEDGVTSTTLTFTFVDDSDIVGFDGSDITVEPSDQGSLGTLTPTDNSKVWTAVFSRTGNEFANVEISVANNTYQDSAGNNGRGDTYALSLSGPVGSCGKKPSNVDIVSDPLLMYNNWSDASGRKTIFLEKTGKRISSFEITASNSSTYGGDFKITPMAGNGDVKRHFWMSECPGGESLKPANRCDVSLASGKIAWTQNSMKWRCPIEPGKRFYINMQLDNPTPKQCPRDTSCGTYIQVYASERYKIQ
jgi:hypothetical protein